MAKIEIEESELAALQRVSKFAQTALANPKTRRTMLEVQKTLDPEAVIPELDATESVMKVVKGVEDKLDGVMKAITDTKAKDDDDRRTADLSKKIQAGQEHLRKHGYNDDGIKKIEELMLQESIGSYAAGLALFESLNPPAAPSDASRSSRWGASLEQDFGPAADDYKELFETQGQSENWLQRSLAKVRSDFRN